MVASRRNALPTIAIAGGLLLLSSMQSAQANNRAEGFRAYRDQNPSLDRRTARIQYGLLHRRGVGGASLPGGLTAAKPVTFVMTVGPDGVVTCGAPNQRLNRLDRINERLIRKDSTQLTDNGGIVRLSNSVDLDLTSHVHNITLGKNLFSDSVSSIDIAVGGETKTVTAGSRVTAAEYVAVKQVLAGGGQKVSIDSKGTATGGQVDLGSLTQDNDVMRASALVVASNVTTYGDFGRRSDFRLLGNLDNYGTIETSSSDSNVRGGALRAQDIYNHSGASINSSADLHLDASGDLTNEGTISSAQALTLSAGGSINNRGAVSANGDLNVLASNVNNSGTLQSNAGNITFNAADTASLTVENAGGTVSALAGAINLRNADYTGSGNGTIIGGDLLSQQLNLNSGTGEVNVRVNELTGTISETGTAAHVLASTESLNIGEVCLTGDPTFYNNGGEINISGNITVAEELAIIAKGDIRSADGITIKADDGNKGRGITFIAGAAFTAVGGKDSPSLPTNPLDAGAVTLSGKASTSGGSIKLGNNVTVNTQTANTVGDNNGGYIEGFAFAGKVAGSGSIDFSGTTLISGGRNAGVNGNILLIAGAKSGVGITMGAVDTTGGTGFDPSQPIDVPGGFLTLVTCQPTPVSKAPVIYDAKGVVGANTFGVLKTRTKAGVLFANASAPVNLGASLVSSAQGGNLTIKNGITTGLGAAVDASDIVLDAAAAPFTAPSFQLNAHNGSVGSASNPLRYLADFVFLTASDDVFITTTSNKVLKVNGNAGGTFSAVANNASISTLSPIEAKNVELSAFQITKNTISGASNITLKILDPNFDVSGSNVLSKLDSLTLDIAGNIGTLATPYKFDAIKNVKVISGKNAFLEQNSKKAGIYDLKANGELSFFSTGGSTITRAESTTDDLTLVERTRALTIKGPVTAKNSITISNVAAKSGKITFAANTTVKTNAKTPGLGAIDITVGPGGAPLVGVPANVKVELKGGVVNFTGSGVKAKSPENVLTAEGANISINNGFASSAISFGGGVKIHADPPVPEGTETIILSGPTVHGTASDSTGTISGSSLEVSAVQGQDALIQPAAGQSLLSRESSLFGANNLNALTASNVNLVSVGGQLDLSPDDSYMLVSKPSSLEHDASLCTDLELQSSSSTGSNSGGGSSTSPTFENQIRLNSGSTLVCATKDTVVKTPHGDVSIAAGAMALVSTGDQHLSVYDIFDEAKGSVSIDSNGKHIALAPGRHITVALESAVSFGHINPIEAIAHRGVARQSLGNEKCVFGTEFSITGAVQAVKPLREIMKSKTTHAKKVANRLVKTAAVVAHISSGSEQFEIHAAPRAVALK